MKITSRLSIADDEIEFTAVRAQGAGGQHVNKTNSAAQLRFDIRASSLPQECKARLLALGDRRISGDGVLVIKAQTHRSLERNRTAALERLAALIRAASVRPRPRRPTRPTASSKRKRLEYKTRHGRTKAARARPGDDD
ncbi:MAG: aminoacyl-tRNA hydrolase [Gammaproteobacteria bacterium]|nr:aminoacyl-tRNA hydrolase [Gammaproteobacteria bacterium]